jgi:hypothetical protein
VVRGVFGTEPVPRPNTRSGRAGGMRRVWGGRRCAQGRAKSANGTQPVSGNGSFLGPRQVEGCYPEGGKQKETRNRPDGVPPPSRVMSKFTDAARSSVPRAASSLASFDSSLGRADRRAPDRKTVGPRLARARPSPPRNAYRDAIRPRTARVITRPKEMENAETRDSENVQPPRRVEK